MKRWLITIAIFVLAGAVVNVAVAVCGWVLVSTWPAPSWFLWSIRPIWFNTLFYAAALWVLIRGPFVLRRVLRFIRVRGGLCPKCAYPMGESPVCSECGKPLPGRTVIPS